MATMTKEEKLALINENLAEVLNPEVVEQVMAEGRPLKIYWGRWPLTLRSAAIQ
jgi:tyrosyl-tRNA synthetase